MRDRHHVPYSPTLTQRDRLRLKSLNPEIYASQGVDLALLAAHLAKTPTERIEINNRMLEFISSAAPAKHAAK